MFKDGNAPQRTTTVAKTAIGDMRLVSLRLNHKNVNAASANTVCQRNVAALLAKEVKPPFFCHRISPTTFAFAGRSDDANFDEFIEHIHQKLNSVFFGSDNDRSTELMFYAGTDVDVAHFLSERVEEARRRSQCYMHEAASRKRVAGAKTDQLTQIPGDRPLLYRGILACSTKALLAYALTPASNASVDNPASPMRDTDMGRYLKFRAGEAIDFSIRIFNEASKLLHKATGDMRPVILLVPICYNSLLSPQDRDKFYANMKKHPDWIRKQLILTIFNTPAQPSTSIVQRSLTEFANYFPNIDWHVSSPQLRADIFTSCPLQSITFDLNAVPATQRMRSLESFAKNIPTLRSHHIRTAVTGVDFPEELEFCLKHDVVYVSGDAVTASLPHCGPPQTIDLKDLPILDIAADDNVSNAA